ncbi:hypothetical protein [Faecalibacter rhinopitheci]|uniref:Uncharacterized protein n=1 Tax=Faecalibacter rhinopitheci TaxID=2779678 RepID=A0A8J7FSC0_9FLAO|nr:hypothetical protein [Faecalibacter rhinopitheci]MBF0595856.1 hypothetical protein [Faecalibacter rhinopitheci]
MTKPYKPRNPYSNSPYSRKRRREETQRQIQELKDSGNWNENDSFGGCLIVGIVLIIIMGFILIIGGPEGLLKWLSH